MECEVITCLHDMQTNTTVQGDKYHWARQQSKWYKTLYIYHATAFNL